MTENLPTAGADRRTGRRGASTDMGVWGGEEGGGGMDGVACSGGSATLTAGVKTGSEGRRGDGGGGGGCGSGPGCGAGARRAAGLDCLCPPLPPPRPRSSHGAVPALGQTPLRGRRGLGRAPRALLRVTRLDRQWRSSSTALRTACARRRSARPPRSTRRTAGIAKATSDWAPDGRCRRQDHRGQRRAPTPPASAAGSTADESPRPPAPARRPAAGDCDTSRSAARRCGATLAGSAPTIATRRRASCRRRSPGSGGWWSPPRRSGPACSGIRTDPRRENRGSLASGLPRNARAAPRLPPAPGRAGRHRWSGDPRRPAGGSRGLPGWSGAPAADARPRQGSPPMAGRCPPPSPHRRSREHLDDAHPSATP